MIKYASGGNDVKVGTDIRGLGRQPLIGEEAGGVWSHVKERRHIKGGSKK